MQKVHVSTFAYIVIIECIKESDNVKIVKCSNYLASVQITKCFVAINFYFKLSNNKSTIEFFQIRSKRSKPKINAYENNV